MSEEIWLVVYDLNSNAFSPSANDVKGVKFTTLYTLQHRLPRNTQFRRGYDHGHVLWWRLLHDARTQFLVDANLPRRTWRDLLASDEANFGYRRG